jgi:hypothetical protein
MAVVTYERMFILIYDRPGVILTEYFFKSNFLASKLRNFLISCKRL